MAPLTLRLELFVDDITASLDFYCRVLGFEQVTPCSLGYTPLKKGLVRVALNLRAELPEEHPIQRRADERLGGGVEIVLEVDDIDAVYRHVVAEQWLRSAELTRRAWELTDFRITDPNGYYWRVTSRD